MADVEPGALLSKDRKRLARCSLAGAALFAIALSGSGCSMLDQFNPFALLKSFGRDPFVLRIPWIGQLARQLPAHKTLMIIGRGVDQMAQNFFLRPMPVGLELRIGEARKPGGGAAQKGRKFRGS